MYTMNNASFSPNTETFASISEIEAYIKTCFAEPMTLRELPDGRVVSADWDLTSGETPEVVARAA